MYGSKMQSNSKKRKEFYDNDNDNDKVKTVSDLIYFLMFPEN